MKCLRESLQKVRSQRGYSLVELSVVLVVLGMILMLAIQLVPRFSQKKVNQNFDVQMKSLNHAIVGFTMVQGRLPCPDTTGDGLENCTPANIGGVVPYLSLGLLVPQVDALAKRLRYAAYQSSNATINTNAATLSPPNWLEADMNLSVVAQRYVPLLPKLDANAATIAIAPFQNNNGLDLCYALRHSSGALGGGALVRADDGTAVRNVAYALASSGMLDADGDGNAFDGRNSLGTNQFDSPIRRTSAQYDDRVYAVSSETLLGQLQCSPSLSAVHAQANVSIASLRSVIAVQDAKVNADIALLNAGVDSAAGVSAGLMAAAAASSAAAQILGATALSVQTTGAFTFAIGLGVASAAMATLAVASAALVNIAAAVSLAKAIADVVAANLLVAQVKLLPAPMINHVRQADQLGVYGW